MYKNLKNIQYFSQSLTLKNMQFLVYMNIKFQQGTDLMLVTYYQLIKTIINFNK